MMWAVSSRSLIWMITFVSKARLNPKQWIMGFILKHGMKDLGSLNLEKVFKGYEGVYRFYVRFWKDRNGFRPIDLRDATDVLVIVARIEPSDNMEEFSGFEMSNALKSYDGTL